MNMADDEIEAIQAIFCQPGEFSYDEGGGESREVKIHLRTLSGNAVLPMSAELCLFLPESYPNSLPSISLLSNQLSKKQLIELKGMLCYCAQRNVGRPMLMDIISLANEELQKCNPILSKGPIEEPHKRIEDQEMKDRMALLHLDHMRAKTQYMKLIQKWTKELSLTGVLIFCQKLILILLQGLSSRIKEFIVRQRTTNVDVDSRGQACKERMLTILCDVSLADHARLQDFQVLEMGSSEELKHFFMKSSMQDIFDNYIKQLKHFSQRY